TPRPRVAPPSPYTTLFRSRFRQSNTGIGRLAANNTRRPQAPVEPPPPAQPARQQPRRGSTEVTDYDIETEVGKEDWKSSVSMSRSEEHTSELQSLRHLVCR